jgi:hypothetical protein
MAISAQPRQEVRSQPILVCYEISDSSPGILIFILWLFCMAKSALKSMERIDAAMGRVIKALLVFSQPDDIDNGSGNSQYWDDPPNQCARSA